MMTDPDHERRTIEVARGNPDAPFGCVILDKETGEVVAEGLNDVERSPVLHGETDAVICLFEENPNPLVRHPEVVYGTSIETLKALGLPHIDLRCGEVAGRTSFEGFAVTGGVLEEDCDRLFEEMARRMSG